MSYPKYYKNAAHQVKVISKDFSVWVSRNEIQAFTQEIETFISERKYPESTESEFKKAFNKTTKYLKSLI